MNSIGPVVTLLALLAVGMAAVFLFLWLRDARRSEKVAEDSERQDTDPSTNPHRDNPADRR